MATVEAQTEEEKVMGPVDYLVVLFPEGGLTGKIAPELRRLSDAGIIRVIDLLIIQKDANGDVDSFEVSEVGGELEEELHVFEPKTKGWLSQEDVEAIGDGMPNRSIAAAMLFENLWAIGVKKAIVDSGGELLESGRIPPELIERAQSESSTITIKEG
jgi:hypothetical protein